MGEERLEAHLFAVHAHDHRPAATQQDDGDTDKRQELPVCPNYSRHADPCIEAGWASVFRRSVIRRGKARVKPDGRSATAYDFGMARPCSPFAVI